MLVLSRFKSQSIMIGDVEVRLLSTGRLTKLGVIAPREIPVHRKEVYDAIQREKELLPPGVSIPSSESSPLGIAANSTGNDLLDQVKE